MPFPFWRKYCYKIAVNETKGGRVMHQPKKRTTLTSDLNTVESPRKASARPVGMQEMGPGLYEQIRRALLELAPAPGT
jgi:hypothetical protein